MGRLAHTLRGQLRALAASIFVASTVLGLNSVPVQAVNGQPQVTLPWGAPLNGDNSSITAKFNGGPHNYFGGDYQHAQPWNSLDLEPTDGRVYAARGGYAYIDCYSEEIYVVHGDGYVTSYTHLDAATIRISSGQYVTRGTWLANTIQPPKAFTCGSGTPPHVHFALWYVQPGDTFHYGITQGVDWGLSCVGFSSSCPTAQTPVPGQPQLGGWLVDDLGGMYSGCMAPLGGGLRQCPNSTQCSPSTSCAYVVNDWLDEELPVARRPGGSSEDLLTRGLSIHAWRTPTDSVGNPTGWTDMGGLFKGSPDGVWNSAGTELDVFGVGGADGVWASRCSTSSCSGWTAIGAGQLVAGTAMSEGVNAVRRTDGGIDLFLMGTDGNAQWASLDSALSFQFVQGIGAPAVGIMGAPSGTWNSQGTRLDVFVIGGDNHPYRKSRVCGYPYCNWDAGWTGPLPGTVGSAGTSGSGATATVTETLLAIRAPDDTIDVFFRGTANDVIHESLDQYGGYLGQESLGGLIKGTPDGKWDAYKSRLDVFVIGLNDQGWEDTWTGSWSGWRLLPGGGTAG